MAFIVDVRNLFGSVCFCPLQKSHTAWIPFAQERHWRTIMSIGGSLHPENQPAKGSQKENSWTAIINVKSWQENPARTDRNLFQSMA